MGTQREASRPKLSPSGPTRWQTKITLSQCHRYQPGKCLTKGHVPVRTQEPCKGAERESPSSGAGRRGSPSTGRPSFVGGHPNEPRASGGRRARSRRRCKKNLQLTADEPRAAGGRRVRSRRLWRRDVAGRLIQQ
ncbi:hypothetical protein KSP39_PZI005380 [Platanthera zijinensis]|uniref:Uncharacterized protein n=1 Tax=Platanthera zijinensis TaxID=2320716 RepID=A0AAP0GAZ2_9ASPA